MDTLTALSARLRDRVSALPAVDLRRRIATLEDEVQELRALNLRLAELTDIVTELLLPVAQRDDERLQALLSRYQKSL